MLLVEVIPILRDNYAYFICDQRTGTTAVIDPGLAIPIMKHLNNRKLDYILNTHHHWDHTDGNLDLKKYTRAQLISPEQESFLIQGADLAVSGYFKFGECTVDVLHVPGHTLGHVAFFFREDKILFSGDTLFIAGCGRVFEGTIEQMYNNMLLLKNLPPETKVYCGHEYTAYNVRFALSIEPQNKALQDFYKKIKTLRLQGNPTVPSTIADEKLINPFFRLDSQEIREQINMQNASDLQVFAKIRSLKDAF